MTERWSVGMLGAIGSASGGVSAATASIIGGGDRLLVGTVTGVGTGGLIATLLFLASRDLPALHDVGRDGPTPLQPGLDGGGGRSPARGLTGRFSEHVVHQADPRAPLPGRTTADVSQPPVAQREGGPTPPMAEGKPDGPSATNTAELFEVLGGLQAEGEHVWAEVTADGDRDGDATESSQTGWPASLAAVIGEAPPPLGPAWEGAGELDRLDGANPASEQGPTTTERSPEASRCCPSSERRAESGCPARDRSTGFDSGLRDGFGRNRRRHRPR